MNTLEILSLIVGFVLRLALPLGITAILVWLLRRVDARWRADALRKVTGAGESIMPIRSFHCWDVRDCPQKRREACPAFQHPDIPCWEVVSVNGHLQEACVNCAFRKQKIALALS